MLSSDQQRGLRQELLASLAPANKYDEACVQLQFKQALLVTARAAPLPASEIEAVVASSGSEVFRVYAAGGAGGWAGLSALIRVYGAMLGPDAAGELRERMQRLAEANALGEPSENL